MNLTIPAQCVYQTEFLFYFLKTCWGKRADESEGHWKCLPFLFFWGDKHSWLAIRDRYYPVVSLGSLHASNVSQPNLHVVVGWQKRKVTPVSSRKSPSSLLQSWCLTRFSIVWCFGIYFYYNHCFVLFPFACRAGKERETKESNIPALFFFLPSIHIHLTLAMTPQRFPSGN